MEHLLACLRPPRPPVLRLQPSPLQPRPPFTPPPPPLPPQTMADLEGAILRAAMAQALEAETWEGLPTSHILESSETMFFCLQQRLKEWAGLSKGPQLCRVVGVWRCHLVLYALHLAARLPAAAEGPGAKGGPGPETVLQQVAVPGGLRSRGEHVAERGAIWRAHLLAPTDEIRPRLRGGRGLYPGRGGGSEAKHSFCA